MEKKKKKKAKNKEQKQNKTQKLKQNKTEQNLTTAYCKDQQCYALSPKLKIGHFI